ncbi:cell division protein FtsQ/DivIB [Maribacter stanieri]|jgi:cell division protein FtsQ|uniref:Cell division protein FtsQ n=1 Tax=Maribacter stanieri TaxID=440514 RepID=A0A1I6KDK8_9FLAO|nr:cell division protein FtsQ/DivIB [Maribacter stanieri]SFR89319.1 cell division protein FtsQ [Maribacter stanieri]|tara:strand:- start:4075 stop:4794 length:720 start_codon:yes stop_codon:yes gene_type:complete
MQVNWNFIKLSALVLVIMGLYAFSNERNSAKHVAGMKVEFVGDQNLYLTEGTVNKLLIQNYGSLENVPKENIVLNTVEKALEANEMVKSAEVYLTIDGELTSKIVQRKPIGRIEGENKFYLDDEGKRMPFSNNHSARVPIITGTISGKSLEDVYVILEHVNKDDFFRESVIGIHIKGESEYQLRLRLNNFVVNIGGIEDLEAKFSNFKAFYAKANKDQTLEDYAEVSLEFNNQVVCTKI